MPGLRPRHQPASVDVLTHNARPHFAKTWLICVRPHGRATQKPAARNRRVPHYHRRDELAIFDTVGDIQASAKVFSLMTSSIRHERPVREPPA